MNKNRRFFASALLPALLAGGLALEAHALDSLLLGDVAGLTTSVRDAATSFAAANPTARVTASSGRIERIAGRRLAIGSTPAESAWAFMSRNAEIFGARAHELSPMGLAGTPTQGVMFDRQTGEYKFTAVYYQQARGGIPVHGANATILVRNTDGNPVELTVNNLRALGNFQPAAAAALSPSKALAKARSMGPTLRYLIGQPQLVIWAEGESPVLADRFIAETGDEADPFYSRQLFILDHATGTVLHREELVRHSEVTGSVSGLATPGLFPDTPSNPPVEMPLAHADIVADVATTTVTDLLGQFILADIDEQIETLTLASRLSGPYATVFNQQGPELEILEQANPPAKVDFLHNAVPSQFSTAQVNAFLHTNLIHDFVESINPSYPGLEETLPVNVNLSSTCNATFSGDAINFRQAAGPGSCPNSAYSSVIYHEYGHFLIDRAGTVQGAYGEGMSDGVTVLVTDDPNLGQDFHGPGDGPLRSAINGVTFPCQDPDPHHCGQIIAGVVWNLREELLATNPDTYRDILNDLVLNSILLNPPGITNGLPVDFLVLDDDDGDIDNGTPHYAEIAAAFTAKGLTPPPLKPLKFTFPNGLPKLVNPAGGTPIVVAVEPSSQQPESGTGVLHVRDGDGPFVAIPMTLIGDHLYLGTFPAVTCGEPIAYYVSAETTSNVEASSPFLAPNEALEVVAGGSFAASFSDDFETDTGWGASNSAGLDDGEWERGIPAGDGTRGDPVIDADGSGQCYLTGNAPGNSDIDGGTTTLISPVLDGTIGDAHIAYWRWYSNSFGNAPFSDIFTVQITNNGTTWVTLETVGPGGDEVSGGWNYKKFRVADFVTPTATMRVRFVASDNGAGSVVEAAVDGVAMLTNALGVNCEALVGDITLDGVVDGEDLGLLLGAWGEGYVAADLNVDGVVDGADLGLLLGGWSI